MRGHVRKRGKRWQAIVTVADPTTGKRLQQSATRATKGEAEGWLLARLVEYGESGASGSSATVAQLFDAWIDLNRDRWSPSTVRSTGYMLRKNVLPVIGKKPLRKLTRADLDLLYVDLSRSYTSYTVSRIHAMIRSALSQAVKWEWIPGNVAKRATVPDGPKARVVPPQPGDVAKLIAAAEAQDAWFGVFVFLAAATGARRGELCALRWGDVDLGSGTLTIERSVVIGDGFVTVKSTKTGNRRRIHLDDAAVGALRGIRRQAAERALALGAPLPAEAFVFSLEPDGSVPLHPGTVTRRFAAVRDKAGVDVRFHGLRHFHASVALGQGVDLATVAGRLGHAGGGATTLAIYAHLMDNTDKAAADAVGDVLARARGKSL